MRRLARTGTTLLILCLAGLGLPAQGQQAADPDMPAGAQIDPGTYLRLRAEHIARLRGVVPGRDPAARQRAIRAMEAQEGRLREAAALTKAGRPLGPSSWTFIGPSPIPNGQTNPSEPVSGRVTAIDVHPTNPNIVYVGTANGGVWRTTDGGTTWTPLMDSAESLAIGAVTIDPVNPSTVFVGTGEGNTSIDSFFGVGLYRIDNADTTPVLSGPFETRVAGTGTTASNGHAFLGESVTKILVDPANDSRVFVGSTFGRDGSGAQLICCGGSNPASAFIGMYFSSNALSSNPTFSRVAGLPGSGLAGTTDMAFEPGSSDNMLVAVEDFGGSGVSGVYRTTNASAASGSTSPSFAQTLALPSLNAKLAITKVGSTVTALAATAEATSDPNNSGLLHESTDGGATWPTTLTAGNGFCGGQCFYDIVVRLDPANAGVIYLGGQVGNGAGTAVLLEKSIDGGSNFSLIQAGLHADDHALAIAPSNTSILYDGNDGGVFTSSNGGTSWTSLNNSTFSATQFESVALHPTDANFTIGGTQDNGTNFFQTNQTWTRADFGDGGYSEIDQNAADTTNVTMYHTYFNRSNSFLGFASVTTTANAHDGAWSFLGCQNPGSGVVSNNGIVCTDGVLFYAPMALGPGNPNTVYFGTDTLYRSSNKGVTMTAVSQAPLVTGQKISAVGISRQNDNVRIVGLNNGQVFETTTGSSTLTDVTPSNVAYPSPATAPGYLSRVVIDPNNPNVAYLALADYLGTTGDQIWKTVNVAGGSATWTPSSSGIPDVPVDAFVVDPANSNDVYAGTDIGVFFSTDGGATWNPLGTGLPRVPVFDMAVQNSSRELRIATHGRGMWQISIATTTPTTTTLTSNANPAVFGQQVTFTATVTPGGAGTPTGTVTFFDGTTNIGMGTISGGVATLMISSLAVGSHSVSAVYGGDSNFQGSTSNTVAQVVNKASTDQVLNSSPNPSVFGQSVTLTATLSAVVPGAGTPTGTVTFMDGTTSLGSKPLSGGVATLTDTMLAVGSHSITTVYGGDGDFTGSTGGGLTQTVNKFSTTTGLNSSANPAVFGQMVTFTATVSATAPGAGTPTGTVNFMNGATSLGSSALSGGVATLMTSLAPGTYSITASYGGDADGQGSTSPPLSQTVNRDATVIAEGASTPNPSVFGQPVTFSATVSAASPGAGTPTGTVFFKEGTATLAQGTLSGNTATAMDSSLSVGTHSVVASYVGDADFTSANSSPVTQTVNKANTTTTLGSSLNPSTNGQSVTFTASVTASAPGAGTPTGMVTFYDGTSSIGTGTLSGGVATLPISTLPVGTDSISAVYGSDGNFNGSTSNTVPQVVNPTSGPNADLRVSPPIHTPTHPVAIGGTLKEAIAIANAGPNATTTTTLTVNLAGNFLVKQPLDPRCSGTTTIVCNLGPLGVGGTASVNFNLTPLLGHVISFQITATSDLPDNKSNNNANDVVLVEFLSRAR